MKNLTEEETFNIPLLTQSFGGVMRVGVLLALGLILWVGIMHVNIVQKQVLEIRGLALRMDILMQLVLPQE